MSASGNQSIAPPEASTETCDAISKQIKDLADRLTNLATAFDPFGPKESHAEGSTAHIAADLRDHADMRLSQAFRHLQTLIRIRAETSHSVDLMVETIMMENGDGSSCLDLL